MRYFRCISLIVLSLFISQSAIAREQADNKSDVAAALTDWVNAVEGGSAEKIVQLYDKNAIMFSVFAVNPLMTHKELLGYYKKVVANPDIKIEITQSHPRQFGNVAVNSGLYTLSYTQDGEPVSIPSRFSFTYIKEGGKWMIVDHHSSKVPLAEEN